MKKHNKFANVFYQMVEKGERRDIPDWARIERQEDLKWIGENLYVFMPAAKQAHIENGRGAIIVDTTQHPPGKGNPFGYFTQEFFEEDEKENEDILRMVRQYNPEEEIVVVLLKEESRSSIYRVKPQPKGQAAKLFPADREQEIFKPQQRKKRRRR